MSSNVVNQTAYLRTSREYPEEVHQLSFELNKTYVDIATAVNTRTIGIHSKNRPSITGEGFFLTTNKQETFRQIYPVSPADISAGFILHQIKDVTPGQFDGKCCGSYTDGINSFGLFFASSVPITGQTTFYVSPTQIVFVVGAGAPPLTSGLIILEWLVTSPQR